MTLPNVVSNQTVHQTTGNSVRQVQEKVARKKITDFAFHSVPSRRLAMAVKLPIHLDSARWFATILEI